MEAYKEDDQVLEINLDMVVEPVLCLRKQEATEVNTYLHQGATCLMETQCQVNIKIYTGTLRVMHSIVMSRSSSRWDFYFHSYVLTIYVRLY